MNIFYLDHDVTQCAKYHNDRHVVKMIIEYAQLLSTAHRILDGQEVMGKTATGRNVKRWVLPDNREQLVYKASHINHPSAKWTRECSSHYEWLYNLFCAVCDEYTYRYGKIHMTDMKLRHVLSHVPKNIGRSKLFQQPWRAMPDEVKIGNDSLASYRNYYINNKTHLASWKKRSVPEWYSANI
jgi:hypothetical protein